MSMLTESVCEIIYSRWEMKSYNIVNNQRVGSIHGGKSLPLLV